MFIILVLIAINRVWVTFVYFLSHELFGIQEHFSGDSKATSGLLGGIEASYTPVHLYNMLVITHVLDFTLYLGNN